MTLNSLISVLRNIRNYYSSRRGVGHTQAMLGNRPHNKVTFVLVVDRRHAMLFGDVPAVIPITLDQLDRLMGSERPLLIDNHTVNTLFTDAVRHLTVMAALLARSKELLTTFSGLRCRGGAATEWVEAIDAADTLVAEIDALSNAG